VVLQMERTPTALSTIIGIFLMPGLFGAALAQSPIAQPLLASAANGVPAAPPAFKLADVHARAHSKATSMSGGWLDGDHYIVHHATMLDLISKAYGFRTGNILSGPFWIDKTRYDIAAEAPPDTSDDVVKQMLRSLLADRFKLVVHTEDKPLPAYLITAPDGASRMKPSEGSGTPGCKSQQSLDTNPTPGAPVVFSCHAESMTAFATFIHEIMANPATEIDATGLQGQWDFDFKALYPPRTNTDVVNNFRAIESWVGLKIEPGTAPLPVLVVDSVNEKPTPNLPGIAAALPPPAKFAIATIKPSSPDTKELSGNIGNGQVDLTGVTMQFLINFALDLDNHKINDAPKWLDQDKFDISAKVAPPVVTAGHRTALPFDDEDLPQMMKKLLEDRFAFKWHMEDRPADTYVLLAVNPKMKKADPLYHTGCKEGPGPEGKDPRIANPVLGRLISCQNMTMAQFADQLPGRSTGYIKIPMIDATGLTGAYDFVLSFSGYSQVGGINEWSLTPPPPGGPSAVQLVVPPGGLLLFDAIEQQLGLKLEEQKRPMPTLVIDHIDEKPTGN
jgi:uncharacterized protein (TIGR03435 family)